MHISVLINEVLKYFNPKPNQNFIDCTLGDGGHTMAILERTKPNGKVIGIDLDTKKLKIKSSKFKARNRLIVINDNFANLEKIVEQLRSDVNFKIHGILLDLGLSSSQLDENGRGFSFQKNGPLNMNYESRITNYELTAEEIINQWSEEKLKEIFWKYGEEEQTRKIVKAIIEERKKYPIKTTKQLTDLICKIKKPYYRSSGRLHPATKVFQALRITINKELENLEKVLPQAIKILKPQGKLIVISYHSLEDRIVKNFFRQEVKDCICPPIIPYCACQHKASLKIITKKPIVPSKEEIEKNPRSRSAKMRVAEKIEIS